MTRYHTLKEVHGQHLFIQETVKHVGASTALLRIPESMTDHSETLYIHTNTKENNGIPQGRRKTVIAFS